MKNLATWLVLAVALGGCAVGTVRPPPGRAFTGEVWLVDRENNVVTLRQGTEFARVRVTPDQMVALEPHRIATMRGELAPPAEVPVTVLPAPPMVAVPSGPVDQAEVTGTVAAIDPNGRISMNSARGRVAAWVASGAAERFPLGSRVRLGATVRPRKMVAASAAPAPGAASPPSEMPAARPGEPGDFATVTGQILRVDSAGLIRVATPRGPIDVPVPSVARYRVGESVEVRTAVRPAP